jgi:hypothetical protein
MLDKILEYFNDETELIKAEGFDDAIIGLEQQHMKLVYSVQLCIEILMKDGMTLDEAIDYFEFNVRGSLTFDSPLFVDTDWD